jgi:uncharacterized tellurite resistance protein B-like protein
MPRWSKKLGNSVNFAIEKTRKDGFLEDFYEKRVFEPENEQEQREYEEFSFVTSSMALAVYVALGDGDISKQEKENIIKELVFQLEHRYEEFTELSEEMGSNDREIINSLFEKLRDDMQSGNQDIDNTVRVINMIYENNPYKRNYLLRLCYMVGFSDANENEQKNERIKEIAHKMQIEQEDIDRIRKEVKLGINARGEKSSW